MKMKFALLLMSLIFASASSFNIYLANMPGRSSLLHQGDVVFAGVALFWLLFFVYDIVKTRRQLKTS